MSHSITCVLQFPEVLRGLGASSRSGHRNVDVDTFPKPSGQRYSAAVALQPLNLMPILYREMCQNYPIFASRIMQSELIRLRACYVQYFWPIHSRPSSFFKRRHNMLPYINYYNPTNSTLFITLITVHVLKSARLKITREGLDTSCLNLILCYIITEVVICSIDVRN